MKRFLPFWLALLVTGLFAASLMIGPAGIALLPALRDWWSGADTLPAAILLEIRLPRAGLALLAGAALGLSGAAWQGFLRNPLAEPGLLGISGMAALGAVIAFYFGFAARFALAVPFGGLAGAFAGALLLAALAGRGSTLALALAGLALSSLAGALTALALSLSANPYAMAEIVVWLLGSVADRSLADLLLAAPFVMAGCALLLTLGRALDALSLGEETAASLGTRLGRVRLLLLAGTTLAVGAAVAVTGAIGFVGLVVPHLLRPLTGARPARLLPVSALGGAALLLAADCLVRLLPGQELKLGVVTALIGAPFFLWLVVSRRAGGA